MKKLIIIAVGILLSIVTVYLVVEYAPKDVQLHAQGVKYQLGTDLSEQLVDVNIVGKLSKSWDGERRFHGTIDIEGEDLPISENYRNISSPFFDNGFAHIIYPHFQYDKYTGAVIGSSFYLFGAIVINEDFSKVAILVNDQDKTKDGAVGWSQENGQVVTVPATNRAEAINVSNEVMKDYLQGLTLE